MEITEISLILTSITALAAVIGPIISSVINVRSNERTRKYEMYSPRVYAAVQRFTEAYSKFPRSEDFINANEQKKDILERQYAEAYRAFSSSAYEVMSLVPNQEIHDQVIALLIRLERMVWVDIEIDKKFQALAKMIAMELASDLSTKKKHITRKAKRGSGK